jgi:hypothetical protein
MAGRNISAAAHKTIATASHRRAVNGNDLTANAASGTPRYFVDIALRMKRLP